MARLPVRTVVLFGAGVSRDSKLPDAAALARWAFESVARGTGYPKPALDAVARELCKKESQGPLRLEVALDLMAREVPATTLAGIYSVLQGAQPSRPHHVLARVEVPLITTNQDELVELAMPVGRSVDVLHLHGRASHTDSVVTMLSQYVEGLPKHTATRLRSLVVGRHLIVIGYSGRDRDVVPYLYDAARITWLQFHQGAGPAELSHEAQRLKNDFGSRMRVIGLSDPPHWLFERLTAANQRAVDRACATAPPATFTPTLSAAAAAAFDTIPLLDRRLAVARVLIHCHQPQFAYDGVQRCLRSWPKEPRAHLRLAAIAEVLQRRPEALRRYARAAALASDPVLRASALLGRAHVNANSTHHSTALDELDRAATSATTVSDLRIRRRLLTRITNLCGRIHAMTDQEDAAVRDYRESAALARRNHDLDSRVTALVFGSDVLHSRGLYVQAQQQLAEVMEDNALYSRPQTRVWAHFYCGLVMCSTGRLNDGMDDLRACRDAATQTQNWQAVAWAEVALASYHKVSDPDTADGHLAACHTAIQAHGAPMTVCEIRLEWEQAELARARSLYEVALNRIDTLERKLAAPDAVPMPYMIPHCLAVRGEIARDRHDPNAPDLLRRARDLYRAGHWRHSTLRMAVALWLTQSKPTPPAGLLEQCRRYDYGTEVDRLLGRTTGYYPLHSW